MLRYMRGISLLGERLADPRQKCQSPQPRPSVSPGNRGQAPARNAKTPKCREGSGQGICGPMKEAAATSSRACFYTLRARGQRPALRLRPPWRGAGQAGILSKLGYSPEDVNGFIQSRAVFAASP